MIGDPQNQIPGVRWVDKPLSQFTTAMVGACLVGRVFYGEGPNRNLARWYCALNLGANPYSINKTRSRADAETQVEDRVKEWFVNAMIQTQPESVLAIQTMQIEA